MTYKSLASLFAAGLILLSATSALALPTTLSSSQNEYERGIEAVVRNKNFYKSGKFEVGGFAGLMPYDSLTDHYMLGGRLTWHLSDHYGWEVIDLQMPFGTTTSYTTDLVSAKGLVGGVQVQKLKLLASSSFLMSPLYGKLRFLGASTIHYDMYLVAGLGFAQNQIMRYTTTGTNGPVSESVMSSGGAFMFNFGFGFKVFMNNTMGLVIDVRDYVTMTQLYGKTSPKSNFAVLFGLTFFLPNFG